MDVIIKGQVANRRLVVSEENEEKARAYIIREYGDVPIESMWHGDKIGLYWVSQRRAKP